MLSNLVFIEYKKCSVLSHQDLKTIENLHCYFDFDFKNVYEVISCCYSQNVINLIGQVWKMYRREYYEMLAENPDYFCSLNASEYYKIWCHMKNDFCFRFNPQIKNNVVVAKSCIPYSHLIAIFGEDGKQFVKFYEEDKSGFAKFCETRNLELKLVFLDKQVRKI